MYWLDEQDDSKPPAHVCSAACTKLVGSTWVCSRTDAVLGPAMLAPHHSDGAARRQKSVLSQNLESRFATATQQLMRRLIVSDRRVAVETSRASKARSLAVRAAQRAMAPERGKLPNLGHALCVALSVYERHTSALEISAGLTPNIEAEIIRAATEFFAAHMARVGATVGEVRPGVDGLALATLYSMREGIGDVLPRNSFLAANLPELTRLRAYNCKISLYTSSRRYILSVLDDSANRPSQA